MKSPPTVLLQVSEEYSFTINPDKQSESVPPQSLADRQRCDVINDRWKNMLKQFSLNGIDFRLQMEASEPYRGNRDPTKSGSRLHYHGLIFFNTVHSLKWFHMYGSTLLSKTCSFEIDTIDDPDYWESYCNKQSFLEWPHIATFKYSNRVPSKKGPKRS